MGIAGRMKNRKAIIRAATPDTAKISNISVAPKNYQRQIPNKAMLGQIAPGISGSRYPRKGGPLRNTTNPKTVDASPVPKATRGK